MSIEQDIETKLTPDQEFRETAIQTAREAGLYLECDSYFDTGTGEKRFYAMVMDSDEHQRLVEQDREEQARINRENHSFGTYIGTRPLVPVTNVDILPWEQFAKLPTFVWGAETAEAAIRDAAQALIKNSRRPPVTA